MQTPASTSDAPAADGAAINAIVAGLMEAWNKGDSHTFAAHYAEDGSFTNILGMTLYGRAGFEKQHEVIFTTIYKGSHVSFETERIHMVRPEVAIVNVTSKLGGVARFPPGMQAGPDGVLTTKLLLVMSKSGGQWQMDAFHNVAVGAMPPRP